MVPHIISDRERHILHVLLHKGAMTQEQLAQLCKNAFGWSGAVIRRTQKSLLKHGLITLQDGQITATVTQEVLEDNHWDHLVIDTFEWTAATQPAQKDKMRFFRNIWFWCSCALAILALVLAFFPTADNPQSPAGYPFPEELTICREALEQWQVLDSYKITAKIYRYPDSGGSTQWNEQYWVSGEDLVLINYAQSTLSSKAAGYMYRNGIHYTTTSPNNPLWIAQPVWEPTLVKIWPMVFDWDDYELIYMGTTKTDYDSVVNFTAVDRSPEEVYTVYHLQFQLTLSGKLHSITVIQVRANDVIAKDVYYLSSSNADQIAQFIADQQEITFSDGYVPETE